MGLAEIQRVLAPLYTNSELRQQFLADPIAVGLRLGLTPAEAQQLALIAPKELNFFAHSLQHKRQQEVAKMLPATERALGRDFSNHFAKFADQYLPSGNKKHYHDAIAFAAYLQQRELADWIKELARYESSRLRALSARLVIEIFRYPVDQLPERLMAAKKDDQSLEVTRRRTLVIWWRLSVDGRLHHRIIRS